MLTICLPAQIAANLALDSITDQGVDNTGRPDAAACWRRADGNLPALDAGAPGSEEAGHHALNAPQEFLDKVRRERQVREMAQDTPLMRALGLAHHWQRLLNEGRFSSMTEIAAAEGIDLGQASKRSRLAQLTPDLVEAIALGRLEVGVTQLLRGKLSASWLAQREALVAGSR